MRNMKIANQAKEKMKLKIKTKDISDELSSTEFRCVVVVVVEKLKIE